MKDVHTLEMCEIQKKKQVREVGERKGPIREKESADPFGRCIDAGMRWRISCQNEGGIGRRRGRTRTDRSILVSGAVGYGSWQIGRGIAGRS